MKPTPSPKKCWHKKPVELCKHCAPKKVKAVKCWANEQEGEILFAEKMYNTKKAADANGIPKCPCKTPCEECLKIRAIRVLITPL